MATPKEDNPLWTLRSFYFLPCDLMYQNLNALRTRFEDQRTRESVADQYLAYLMYWLAGLFVIAEGWRELGFTDPDIDKLLGQHWDSLRLFRNAVFHFQLTDRKQVQFFGLDKLNWAGELHRAWLAYFANQDC